MKKFSLIVCALLFLGLSSAVYAEPAGNTTGPVSQGIEKHPPRVNHGDHGRGRGPMEFQEHHTWRHLGHHLDLTQE